MPKTYHVTLFRKVTFADTEPAIILVNQIFGGGRLAKYFRITADQVLRQSPY